MKATNFEIEGVSIQMPSDVSIVSGLDDYTNQKLANFSTTTLASAINSLSNVYLGKTAKAASATTADTATSATKATQDGSGRVITSTYYTTNTTVAKATADAQGSNFVDTYAKKTGSYTGLTAGNATVASSATKATGDKNGIDITTYLRGMSISGKTITMTTGAGVTSQFTTQDTTYSNATTLDGGLMSAADKIKLNGIDAGAQAFGFTNTSETDLNNMYVPGAYRFTRIDSSILHAPYFFHNQYATSFMLVFNSNRSDPSAGSVVQMLFSMNNGFWYRTFQPYTEGQVRFWCRMNLAENTDTQFADGATT